MKNKDNNLLLMRTLGISPDQIDIYSGKRPPPDYLDEVIKKAQNTINNKLISTEHWAINRETLEEIFNDYQIVGTWRKTNYKRGHCCYDDNIIQINFGHYSINREQCYKTLLHEYVHAIIYSCFNYSGHGEIFQFYLHLLTPTIKEGVQ